jgi:hypothetical protein
MAFWVKVIKASLAGLLALSACYIAVLCHPQPLFAYKYSAANISLYCDEPIPLTPAAAVLSDVQARLEPCPFYRDHPARNAFICDNAWRYRLFFAPQPKSGGLAYGFPPWNVFLRKSDISRNVLFRADGVTPSGPDRPLSYFIAHEITHTLTARFLGPWAYWRLPAWKNEGYSDYVGKNGRFDFQKNLGLFRKGDPALDPGKSGLYLRYHLLVAELLDHRKMTPEELLKGDFDRSKLEAELRAGRTP